MATFVGIALFLHFCCLFTSCSTHKTRIYIHSYSRSFSQRPIQFDCLSVILDLFCDKFYRNCISISIVWILYLNSSHALEISFWYNSHFDCIVVILLFSLSLSFCSNLSFCHAIDAHGTKIHKWLVASRACWNRKSKYTKIIAKWFLCGLAIWIRITAHISIGAINNEMNKREREWSRDWGKKNEVSWICVRQTGKKVDADCKYCGSWATKPLACAQFFLHTLIESEFIVSTSE